MTRRRISDTTQGAGVVSDLAHNQAQAGSTPALATSPEVVSTETGEITDALSFMEQLREIDASIAKADRAIGSLKEELKFARSHREGLVAELRAVARGERALPLEPETRT